MILLDGRMVFGQLLFLCMLSYGTSDGCALKANAAIQYSAGGETAGLAATVISR